MITLEELSCKMGATTLFEKSSLTLSNRRCYGIVGANGSGKSTLLKIIAGLLDPDTGAVHISSKLQVGYLKQDQSIYDHEPILQIVLRGKKDLYRLFQEKETLLNQLELSEEAIHQLALIEDKLLIEGGYEAESIAEGLLIGLGIPVEKHHDPLKELSGGYKMRVLLAKSLFNNPDILLLDEPTNYLDIDTIKWLENFLLNQYKGLLLLISHDVTFLNHLAEYIIDIDYGKLTLYTGNYSSFLIQKQAAEESLHHEKKHVEKKVEVTQAFIEKFRSKPSKAGQCRSRQKMLDKIEWPEIRNSSRRYPKFAFAINKPNHQKVLECSSLTTGYQKQILIKEMNLELYKKDKIALIGPNGIGKSTLIRTLLGLISPLSGTVTWSSSAEIGFYLQDQICQFYQPMNLLEWMQLEVHYVPESKIRAVLGACLFDADAILKKVYSLSGGEAVRLILAKMMLTNPNVLVFDEPTNHLDMEAKASLIKALQAYSGALLLVSHDRDFIEKTTHCVIELA